jgi:hypothetical protein
VDGSEHLARAGTVGMVILLLKSHAPPVVLPQPVSKTKKPVVVVLGFGWGAHALVKVRQSAWQQRSPSELDRRWQRTA